MPSSLSTRSNLRCHRSHSSSGSSSVCDAPGLGLNASTTEASLSRSPLAWWSDPVIGSSPFTPAVFLSARSCGSGVPDARTSTRATRPNVSPRVTPRGRIQPMAPDAIPARPHVSIAGAAHPRAGPRAPTVRRLGRNPLPPRLATETATDDMLPI